MTSLASLSDLGVRLGQDLTGNTRAQALLDDVSANVVTYTGRDFTKHENQTATIEVVGGKAKLPDGPVIAVSSVKQDGADVAYTWASGRTITGVYACGTVDVVYTWGYEAVPGDVAAVVCQVAGRAYGTKPQDSGNTSESLGGWSFSTGGAAASGPLGLLNGERETLDRYRLRHRGPIAQNSWAM